MEDKIRESLILVIINLVGIVTLGDQVINKSTRFRYLRSIVQSDGEVDRDIISRIQVGWLKWRNASGLLCDRKVPLTFKEKFYKMVVRPTMIYCTECRPLKEKHKIKLSVAEMRMLRWMNGFTLTDKMRNERVDVLDLAYVKRGKDRTKKS
ncbi:hypothetical protein KFK09_029264 [Dendrobium nobile]|uniref:Uncharacterized protein n=1 Tax=Dendrobium nobile TaxID=94219 RepID=A0A8T3A5H2_DENNO|nr:hypothetical protein KFK09_029264 [Dendrobium nobile]